MKSCVRTSMALRVFPPTINIHLKTKTHSGETAHGYLDALYFRRCLEELQNNCVTVADIAA